MALEEPQQGAPGSSGPRPAGWAGWVIALVPGLVLAALSVGIVLDELIKRLAQ